jgi:hypothetical protein
MNIYKHCFGRVNMTHTSMDVVYISFFLTQHLDQLIRDQFHCLLVVIHLKLE